MAKPFFSFTNKSTHKSLLHNIPVYFYYMKKNDVAEKSILKINY